MGMRRAADSKEAGVITNDISARHRPSTRYHRGRTDSHNRRLVGFAGSVAHAPDIGGRIRSPDARDVFKEGLQIPIMKAVRAGKVDPMLEAFVRKNTRVPDQVMGDLHAQFTALTLMEQRIKALLIEAEAEVPGRTSARDSRALRSGNARRYTQSAEWRIPPVHRERRSHRAHTSRNGAHREERFARNGVWDRPSRCSARSTSAWLTPIAYTAFGVKAVLAPHIPNNEGVLRPITISTEGSICNSKPPAAGGARALIGHFFPMMVIQALSKALPERVIATVGSPALVSEHHGAPRRWLSFRQHVFRE